MKKTKTQAFANLIGSLIFIALGAWALTQTYSFQEVKKTPTCRLRSSRRLCASVC